MIHYATVVLVNRILYYRVESGSLLPHVDEQSIRRTVVDIRSNEYRGRRRTTRDDCITSGFSEGGEIQAMRRSACGERP
jgi:hypothetical protein